MSAAQPEVIAEKKKRIKYTENLSLRQTSLFTWKKKTFDQLEQWKEALPNHRSSFVYIDDKLKKKVSE